MKQIFFLLLLFISLNSFGQVPPSSVGDTSTIAPSKFVPAPYINYSRSIGFAGGVVPMYMWNINKKDTISPQSLVGGLGIYSTNKTYFVMGFAKLYLNEDKWRIMTGGGNGNINFQVFVSNIINNYIDYSTDAWFFKTILERKITDNLYGGIVYMYTSFGTVFDILSDREISSQFHSPGLILEFDNRDNVYYPYGGNLISMEWNSYPTWLSNDQSSNILTVSANKYWAMRSKKDVFAARIYGQFGLGEIGFNQEIVAMGTDLRGYTQGKYRGEGLFDFQGEYRYNISDKFGLVGFGGLATIYGSDNEEFNGLLLPSIGTGIRFNVFPSNHMNIGLDVAAGRDDWGVYFRIGEAF